MRKIPCSITLHGVDGSVWEIHGREAHGAPVQIEKGSLGDLLDAPVNTSRKARVGQPGTHYRGRRYLERNITLDVTIKTTADAGWETWDSAFRQALDYEEEATLTVSTEMSGDRDLKVRLSEHPEMRGEYDPHVEGRIQMTFQLVADDPFYTSGSYSDAFVFDGMNFTGGSVTVTNPCDVPAWPKWVLTAPAKFILPDVSFRDDEEKDRQVVLPMQPIGRTVLVDTDPGEEMIVANDDVLAWAQMDGQFFNNPIPPHTGPTQIPVGVDPLPNMPWYIPDGWRMWIADRIEKWAERLGYEEVIKAGPAVIAAEIKKVINGVVPDFLEALHPDLIKELVPSLIAERIAADWGSIWSLEGATAQIRLERKWTRPWGME